MSDVGSYFTAKNAKLALLVILVLIVGYALLTRKEGLIGGGITDQVFTSGATQRRLGQEFSMPSQGTQETIYLDNLKSIVPGGLNAKEGLVSTRGEPDFWNINRTLEDYKASQLAPAQADAASGTAEAFTPTTLRSVEDELLRNQLY